MSLPAFPRRVLQRIVPAFFAALIGWTPSVALADDKPTVVYAPGTKLMQGDMPFDETYTLTIKSPSNFEADNGSRKISLTDVQISDLPIADRALALSFLTFSTTELEFDAPNQSKSVNIRLRIPVSLQAYSFGYQIYARGWEFENDFLVDENGEIETDENGNPVPAVTNFGATINVAVQGAVAPILKPVVTITEPTGTTNHTFNGATPVTFPFKFNAVSLVPITSVYMVIDNHYIEIDPAHISGLGGLLVNVDTTVQLASAGNHTITAFALNGAPSFGSDTRQVEVELVVGPPEVAIAAPTPNQEFVAVSTTAGPRGKVDFVATGQAGVGTMSSLVLSIDGGPGVSMNLTGANGVNGVVGTLTQHLAPGTYEVKVVGTTDDGRTNAATQTFTVTLKGPPVPAILSPLVTDIHLVNSSVTADVFFKVSGTATFGSITNLTAVVDHLTATPITVPLSVLSIDGLTRTSTATLAIAGEGTHTLLVTATDSQGFKTSTEGRFVLSRPAAPTASVTTPTAGQVFLVNAPDTRTVSFTVSGHSADGTITSLVAFVGSQPLTLGALSSTDGGHTVTASGSMSVSGLGSHTVKVTATDSFGFTGEGGGSFELALPAKPTATVSGVAAPVNAAGVAAVTISAAGTSLQGTIASLAVSLDGNPIGTLTGVSSGTLSTTVSGFGSHSLTIVATDSFGFQATGSGSFTVALPGGPTALIAAPVISPVVSGSANVTITVSGTAFLGSGAGALGGIQSLVATLDGEALELGDLQASADGKSATATAVVLLPAGSSHTITLQATDKLGLTGNAVPVSFTVPDAPPPPPVIDCEVFWLPPISLNKVQKGGSTLPVKFRLDCGGVWEDGPDRNKGKGNDKNDSCCGGDFSTTVVVRVSEIFANGTETVLKVYHHEDEKQGYSINGNHYQLNYTLAKGVHKYRFAVYEVVDGAEVLLDDKVVVTK